MGITDKTVNNYLFKGEYDYSMDEKRRVSIPSKMRERLGDEVVVTRWVENCLVLYPAGVWGKVADWLQSLPVAKKETRAFVRLMFSGAADLSFDKLGRVLIPDYLAEYAGLEKDVIIVGVGRQIEIWSKKRWEKYRSGGEAKMDEMLGEMEEI